MAVSNPLADPLLCQLDHVVLAVHDLVRTSEDFRALGFTVTPGGRHPGRSSHNALVVFEDGSYIEIIAWLAPAPEERWWRTLQACGEGLVDHALLPNALDSALQAAQARGLDTLRGPLPGGRKRPDGLRIEWTSARHDTPDVPFLCADHTPRAMRVPEGPARQHANGATGIAKVAVAVQNLALSRRRWAALLGPSVALDDLPGGPGWGRCGYTLATTEIQMFGRAATANQPPHRWAGYAFERAHHRLSTSCEGEGEGPFALCLHAPGPQRLLDPSRCCNTPIWLGAAAEAETHSFQLVSGAQPCVTAPSTLMGKTP